MSHNEDHRSRRDTPAEYNILIVDDEPGDVELIRLAIETGPYKCVISVAENGMEALASLRHQTPGSKDAPTPDLVLMDINMPKMNGKETLKAIKGDPALAGIPVVMLTTSDAAQDISAVYALGAGGYITKPLDVDELFTSIRKLEEFWFDRARSTARAKMPPIP